MKKPPRKTAPPRKPQSKTGVLGQQPKALKAQAPQPRTRTQSKTRDLGPQPQPKALKTRDLTTLDAKQIDHLRTDLQERAKLAATPRWNADPEDIQKSVIRLVLALVEFLRKLLERQAIRRMEENTLTPKELEDIGLALMRLEDTVRDLAAQFGLRPEELNLDLGPLGRLM